MHPGFRFGGCRPFKGYASVTHLVQGLRQRALYSSLPPLACSPQKTLGSPPCSGLERLSRSFDKSVACHFMASRPLLIHDTGVTVIFLLLPVFI